jgi:hypothetical protein
MVVEPRCPAVVVRVRLFVNGPSAANAKVEAFGAPDRTTMSEDFAA